MTTIYLKDRGVTKPGNESETPFTGATNIANNGVELPLKGISISYSRGISFDNKPQPGAYVESRLNYVSVTNPLIMISGTIKGSGDLRGHSYDPNNIIHKISDGNTSYVVDQDGGVSTKEIDILFILDLMVTTKGYKELYFKDGSSNGSMLYGLGSTDTGNSTYRHLHVRCKGVTISQDGNSGLIKWTLNCEVERGE